MIHVQHTCTPYRCTAYMYHSVTFITHVPCTCALCTVSNMFKFVYQGQWVSQGHRGTNKFCFGISYLLLSGRVVCYHSWVVCLQLKGNLVHYHYYQQAAYMLWCSAGRISKVTYKPCKLGQLDLVFGLWTEFVSRSVQAGLQASMCSGYDLCHPG